MGCHADAHEQSKWFGDDIKARADMYDVDHAGISFVVSHLGAGRAPLARLPTGLAFVAGGRAQVERFQTTYCPLAGVLARRLGLGEDVYAGLQQVFERWDGRGTPAGLSGEQATSSTIYGKLGVSTRAAAALFASEHGLLFETPPPEGSSQRRKIGRTPDDTLA